MLVIGELSAWDLRKHKEQVLETLRASLDSEKEVEAAWKGVEEKKMVVWGVGRDDDIVAYVATTVIAQGPVRRFVIYAMRSCGHLTDDEWREGFGKMLETAKNLECNEMRAFTANPEIVRVLRDVLGWTIKQDCSFTIEYPQEAQQALQPAKGPEVSVPQ